MMCLECGAQNLDQAVLCKSCGKPFSIAAESDERDERERRGVPRQWRAVRLTTTGLRGQPQGTITKWLKSVGERIDAGEPLYKYSNDYVEAEVYSDCSGVLLEILIPEGCPVPGQTVIAYIKPD
jgi:biotin carboxyl carrier protein